MGGRRADIPAGVPAGMAGLIQSCWLGQPEARPALEAVLAQLTQLHSAAVVEAQAAKAAEEAAKAAEAEAAAAPNPDCAAIAIMRFICPGAASASSKPHASLYRIPSCYHLHIIASE